MINGIKAAIPALTIFFLFRVLLISIFLSSCFIVSCLGGVDNVFLAGKPHSVQKSFVGSIDTPHLPQNFG